MAEFSELVKNFDKIRDYMRDFFVYGFKARGDFTQKSLRTYDNERRRIESYLNKYIKWDTSNKGKRVFISLDSSKIACNPLYAAWKSKSFTSNDIMLHFYILDTLKENEALDIEALTDKICDKSGVCFDSQMVRIKSKEYVNEGIITTSKQGKSLYYSLSKDYLSTITENYENLLFLLKYYQEVSPFGVIGSSLLDNVNEKNDIFSFKHHFIVHTLEDNILNDILLAMKNNRKISFINQSTRLDIISTILGVPLKIFVSSKSGRRYVCIYNEFRKRFINLRLDYIKSIKLLDTYKNIDLLRENLNKNLSKCWGVSFGGNSRVEQISVKLYIEEDKEEYVINRLNREGRGGKICRLEKNIFLYTKELFDTNEIMSWVKSFTGRIISVEGTNKVIIDKFYNDMKKMQQLYYGGE